MSIKILVVDDNRDTLRTYTKALERRVSPKEWNGRFPLEATRSMLEVDLADTVAIALEKLEMQPVDILIVDLKIPGPSGEEMGGLELISQSRRLDPLRSIIAITGYGSVELARKTLTQGVFDFIEKKSTAVDDLIQAVQRAIDARDEKIMRAGNPFTPMTGMEPAVFGGRTEELVFFEQKLYRAIHSQLSEHFLVLGNWGIGKSTLLKEYKKICQSRGYLASIVPLEPLQANTTLIEAAHYIVEGILRDLPYPLNHFREVAGFFASLGINILGTGIQFSRDVTNKEISPRAFLHDTLIRLWRDLEDKTDVFVILLDDLDNFIIVPEIVMTLKQTLSLDSIKKTRILVGIASPAMSWLELTTPAKHHPLARYFISRVELAPLREIEMQETILKSLLGTGVSFSEEIIARVFEYTQGHPFEMQLLCHHLFSNQLSRRVEVDVWDKSLQAALRDIGNAIFDQWFIQASREEAKILSIVAQAGTQISAKEIQETIKRGKVDISLSNIGKYLQRLVEKKLLGKSGRGLYIIPDKMFCAYICNRIESK